MMNISSMDLKSQKLFATTSLSLIEFFLTSSEEEAMAFVKTLLDNYSVEVAQSMFPKTFERFA